MLRIWLVGLISLASSASGAAAAGYDDFAQGLSALNRGADAEAIAFFTSALAAGDLNPNLVPIAYLDRGRAHIEREEYALAIPDLTAALKAKPDSRPAYISRAYASTFVGNADGAVADYTKAIALSPDADGYVGRGRARWITGDFAGAGADFAQSVKMFPKATYWVLWQGMSQMRAGAFDAAGFSDAVSSLDFDGWPRPLFDFYRGRITPEALMKTASDGDARTVSEHRCEANFYIAQWWIARQNIEAAKPLLEDARTSCPANYDIHFLSDVELKRLK